MNCTPRIRTIALCLGVAGAALLQGCASKGYVNDRLDELRADQNALKTETAQLRNSTNDAMDRAQEAGVAAGQARDLALGKAGLEEINRYTVLFDFDSSKLGTPARSTLDQAASQIQAHPEAIVDVYGFADPTGTDAYNLALGLRRADEVVRYLAAATPGQLSKYAAVSYGERDLQGMAPESSDNSQARRVVVALLRRTPLGGEPAPSAQVVKP